MPILIVCPACKEKYEVSDQMAGKKARCSKCWQPLVVATTPASATIREEQYLAEGERLIIFACDGCLTTYSVPEDKAGRRTTCPKCKKTLTVPTPPRNGSTLAPLPAEANSTPTPGHAASQTTRVPAEAQAAPPPQQESNLRPCPDCLREVSRRAPQCPHCGCPLATTVLDKASTFEAVFSAFVQAVREAGHVVAALDKQNGYIAFKTAATWLLASMDFSIIIIDNGDGTCSGDATWPWGGLFTPGRLRKVIDQVAESALKILAARGMPNCFRLK